MPEAHPLEMNDLIVAGVQRAKMKGVDLGDDWAQPVFGAWVDRILPDGARQYVGLASIEQGKLRLPTEEPGDYELELFSAWDSDQIGFDIICCFGPSLTVEEQRDAGFLRRDGLTDARTHGVKQRLHVFDAEHIGPATLDFTD